MEKPARKKRLRSMCLMALQGALWVTKRVVGYALVRAIADTAAVEGLIEALQGLL